MSPSFAPDAAQYIRRTASREPRDAGVVSGIAHCGNCIGVPAIGGEAQVFFRGKMNGCRAGGGSCEMPATVCFARADVGTQSNQFSTRSPGIFSKSTRFRESNVVSCAMQIDAIFKSIVPMRTP